MKFEYNKLPFSQSSILQNLSQDFQFIHFPVQPLQQIVTRARRRCNAAKIRFHPVHNFIHYHRENYSSASGLQKLSKTRPSAISRSPRRANSAENRREREFLWRSLGHGRFCTHTDRWTNAWPACRRAGTRPPSIRVSSAGWAYRSSSSPHLGLLFRYFIRLRYIYI